ncbi:MAG: hypothetical protein ABI743_14050, partial [bacterium]
MDWQQQTQDVAIPAITDTPPADTPEEIQLGADPIGDEVPQPPQEPEPPSPTVPEPSEPEPGDVPPEIPEGPGAPDADPPIASATSPVSDLAPVPTLAEVPAVVETPAAPPAPTGPNGEYIFLAVSNRPIDRFIALVLNDVGKMAGTTINTS